MIGRPALALAATLPLLLAPAVPARAGAAPGGRPLLPRLDVEREVLPNGLTLLTLEDHSLPSVCLYLLFKVGSRNEPPANTGLSHLFEHMMFNGSERFPPKSFDRIIEAGGGYSNGSTRNDFTDYIEEFSPAALDAVLELEADRMRALRLDEQNLEQERGIVINERLVSTDNDVAGTLFEQLWATAFVASPYRWPVVGWLADLRQGIRLEDARRYYDAYYAPDNAVMVLAGDFDRARAVARIRELWAAVPPRSRPRPVVDPEPPQTGEKRVLVAKEAQAPMLMVGYKVPGVRGARAEDAPLVDVLGHLLGRGRSAPLHRRLVDETGLCTSASIWVPSFVDTALATLSFELVPGADPARVEGELDALLAPLRAGEVDEAELARAKTQLQADFLRSLAGNDGRARTLGFHEAVYGDWRAFERVLAAYAAASREEVARVARTYFAPANRTVARLVPEEAEGVDFAAPARPPAPPVDEPPRPGPSTKRGARDGGAP